MSSVRLPKFAQESKLRRVLTEAVSRHLEEHPVRHRRGYGKAAAFLAITSALYAAYLSVAMPPAALVALAITFGFALGGIAFNVQHDGSHGSFSGSRAINRAAAFTLDLIGASSYVWRWKHIVYHHTFPNVDGVDTDIEGRIVASFAPSHRRRSLHAYEHVYLWFLYGFLIPKWHLIDDFQKVITGRIGQHRLPRPRGRELALFIAGKTLFLGLAFGVPLFYHPPSVVIGFYAISALTLGWIASIVFQAGHCFASTRFGNAGDDGGDWTLHQLETTADFARDSPLLTWYLGGLNFQIEHHLFPRLPHRVYPSIAPVVERVCRQYDAPYHAYATLADAIQSHYRFLKMSAQRRSETGDHHVGQSIDSLDALRVEPLSRIAHEGGTRFAADEIAEAMTRDRSV